MAERIIKAVCLNGHKLGSIYPQIYEHPHETRSLQQQVHDVQLKCFHDWSHLNPIEPVGHSLVFRFGLFWFIYQTKTWKPDVSWCFLSPSLRPYSDAESFSKERSSEVGTVHPEGSSCAPRAHQDSKRRRPLLMGLDVSSCPTTFPLKSLHQLWEIPWSL